jgi:hypothetical protein
MDPILEFLIQALAGGVAVAFLLTKLGRRFASRIAAVPPRHDEFPTVAVNIAHIQVVGIGGLGLVATCAVVAWFIPAVGFSLGAGFALGTLLAIVLIVRRKESGPMPSSSQRPGANTILSIDEPSQEEARTDDGRGTAPRVHQHASAS